MFHHRENKKKGNYTEETPILVALNLNAIPDEAYLISFSYLKLSVTYCSVLFIMP